MYNGTEIACAWTLVTGPAQEPVTIDEIKQQIGITDSDSDALLDAYIRTAREAAEEHMGRGLFTQTRKQVQSDFGHVNPLLYAAPLQSVTSVKYYDDDGTLQTLATSVYDTDLVSLPGAVVLKPDQSWPSLQSSKLNGRVEVTYVVGWDDINDIPERIKQGIKVYVHGLDRDRSEPGAFERAKAAAEACWDDRVCWTPPSWC